MANLLNAALLFDRDPTEAFIDYSIDLARGNDFDVVLGPTNIPHLTVLQFEVDGDPERWRALKDLEPRPLPLSVTGLTFIPAKEGHVWVEIQVLKSAALQACQHALASAIENRPIHNGTGDAFRPHITLGRIRASRTIHTFHLDDAIVRMKNLQGRLVVGWAGANYEFLKAL